MAGDLDNADYFAPRFRVELDGLAIPPDGIISVEVDETLDAPAMATVTFNEYLDPASRAFRWLDSPQLVAGAELKVFLGYTGKVAAAGEPLFQGRLQTMMPAFQNSGVPSLVVQGYDHSHGLQKRKSNFSRVNGRASDAAAEIARRNGLDPAGVETTTTVHPSIRQGEDEVDLDFLRRLAKDLGFEIFVRGTTLYFRAPADGTTELLTFEWGRSLVSFTPRLSTAAQVNEVRVRGWNPATKERLEGKATVAELKALAGGSSGVEQAGEGGGEPVVRSIEDRPVFSREEADGLARAELNRLNDGFITGTGETIGTPTLRPGITVAIGGIGKRFSGRYYVKGARHTLGDGGYRTTFEVRRNALGSL